MEYSELKEAVAAGEVLMHGCSLDNLAAILADDALRSGLRKHAGPQGVSLTRSLDIAMQFCRTHEDEFTEVLASYYGVEDERAGRDRHGVVLVFTRDSLADLHILPFVDIEGYDEHEERVLGDVENVLGRLACIVVDQDDLEWYRSLVDEVFHSMGDPCEEIVAALDLGAMKVVSRDILEPSMGREAALT